jgi:hypothetical protein
MILGMPGSEAKSTTEPAANLQGRGRRRRRRRRTGDKRQWA